MATDAVNISEDAEMADYDGDKVVTMMDVLQEQQDFEEDANAVLGASDDKNCTYAKGYIKRQAIYACLTCCPDAKSDPTKRAGVCLACSLNCHENHELVELYTKRNFRCDCGNPKFNSHPCQFTPNKTDLNNDNIYNQNFSGLYCICQRPYPDPESTFEDDMIQCIICEDWLHSSHLDAVVPVNEQYSEMVCKACMEKNEFLHDYSKFAVTAEPVDVDILTVNGSVSDTHCNGDVVKENLSNDKEESSLELEAVNGADVDMSEDKAKDDATSDVDIKKAEDSSPTEEIPKDSTNNSDNLIDSDANNQQEQNSEAKETNEDAKVNSDATEQKDSESENKEVDSDVTKDEQNIETEKVEDAAETQEQSADSTKDNSDKSDVNKTEDQLMDDNSALSSENTDESKSTAVEETAAEESKSDVSESKDDSKNTEESPVEQNISESKDANPVPESSDIKVPDTSQDDCKKEDDAKTDAVMDAIDALLETTTESKDVENNDIEKSSEQTEASKAAEDNAETQKPDDVNMSESENKQEEVPEKVVTDKSDVEMAENNLNNENKDEAPVTSEIETDTSNIESAADDNKLEIESPTEKVLNGDDEALNDADKTKPDDDTSKIEPNDDTSKIEPDDDTSKIEPNDENKTDNATGATNENKRKLSTEVTDENSPKKPKLDSKCVKPKDVKRVHKGATFWPSSFRQKLCTCGECISMYKDLSVLFLIDSDDTVSAYESLGKENVDAGASQYEKGLQALSSLDRIQQINALTEYNRMRDKLLDFLKSFKDRKEIVKEEDIKAFFAGMKPKRESDGVYFCR